jgi:hypothetical protein
MERVVMTYSVKEMGIQVPINIRRHMILYDVSSNNAHMIKGPLLRSPQYLLMPMNLSLIDRKQAPISAIG